MLCSGLLCISLSLVSTYLFTTLLPGKDAVEPVVSREDRLELQEDVAAAEVLAAVGAVLYMSYLWRTLFTAPAAEPHPALEDYREEKRYEVPQRRPSEHKETQYELAEQVQFTTVETQTSVCMLAADWTSSESQLSDSSLSVSARPSDTQMETGSFDSAGTILEPSSETYTGSTLPDYVQASPDQPSLQKETAPDTVVQKATELQPCKASQTSEGLQDNPPIISVVPHLPVESPNSETTENQPATEPQPYTTSSPKLQLPPNAGDTDIAPNSAHGLEPSDVSPREGDAGLIVIREPAVHTVLSPQTFTVSLAPDESPRQPTTSPRSPDHNSCLHASKLGSYAARRRITCNRCLNSRPQAGGRGTAQAPDGVYPTAVKVTDSPSSPTARGDGDAPQHRSGLRPPTAGRGYRTPGKNQQVPCQTYSSLSYRPRSPSPRPSPTYVYKPPFV